MVLFIHFLYKKQIRFERDINLSAVGSSCKTHMSSGQFEIALAYKPMCFIRHHVDENLIDEIDNFWWYLGNKQQEHQQSRHTIEIGSSLTK